MSKLAHSIKHGEIVEEARAERMEREGDRLPELGEWYWVRCEVDTDGDALPINLVADPTFGRLACVTDIGSNYVGLKCPTGSIWRIHVDDLDADLRPAPDGAGLSEQAVDHYQAEAQRLMGEVRSICARLGVSPRVLLTDQSETGGTALVVAGSGEDPDRYKRQLVHAKEELLPDLFRKIKDANEASATWMKAGTLALQAQVGELKGVLRTIEGRIFNVSLYAGLSEFAELVREGEPGAFDAKVHLMQRMMYMDEECLVDYEGGGMSFENIRAFDAWLCKPDNFSRCLPFEKCVTIWRVRRNVKQRENDGTLLRTWINFRLEQSDRFTFMYVRNGERLYRVGLDDFDFDEKMFPDQGHLDTSQPLMVKMWAHNSVDELMRLDEWEDRVHEAEATVEENRRLADGWRRENPKEAWYRKSNITRPRGQWERSNPHTDFYDHPRGERELEELKSFKPFDRSNVFYDEVMEKLHGEIKRFNRVALILQGLLDRSDVFHPHLPARTWETEGFERIFTLVYDGSHVLSYGEAPDFDAYWAEVNATASADSVWYGQELAWEKREAERENARARRNWRRSEEREYTRYRPHGDLGPGTVAVAEKLQERGGKAMFGWERERLTPLRRRRYGEGDGPIRCTIAVPTAELFNVSGYRPGDYKRFYSDPRTRQDYLKWAPYLLTAEDYHAGKLTPGSTRDKSWW